jgi:glycosyltransferase involved in cell wall biosynthesis
MPGPLVTVVVPAHNAAAYLDEALDAIAAQDYSPLQVIVVDDGSTDETAILARARESVMVVSQPNAGPSAARNAGIAQARGDYITFCDADDVFRPSKVRVQSEYLDQHDEVGCVLVHHETFFATGTPRPDWLTDDEGVQPQSAMVRRSVVDAVGGFDPDYQLTEGMEWLSRMRDAGIGIAVLEDVCVDRRIHGSNLSYQRAGLQHNMLRSLRARIERSRGAGVP